jgi:alkanesulfonate monooxygenase SsuD/methylene tetrahydromethanopterin reductase-like flavin-dependent oxidoreductase (luciferase family)
MNSREWSYETLTHAAALGAVTQNIAVFATVHVPMVHPVFAAKALTTIDHVSNGRAGLNIVCGWNPEEFGMFGLELIEERYEQGLEWFEIMNRIYTPMRRSTTTASSTSSRPCRENRARCRRRGRSRSSGVLAAGARVCGESGRLSVTTFTEIDKGREHIDDMKKRAAAERSARSASTRRATWCAARRRPRPRPITRTTR